MQRVRIVVIGCCGAGKSHLSANVARRLGIPHYERDALGRLGSDDYRLAVTRIVAQSDWVFDGPPFFVDDLVYGAAQTVVWLDYARHVVLGRAIRRALRRSFGCGLAPNASGGIFDHWFGAGGPVFANAVFAARHREFETLSGRADIKDKLLRFATPNAADRWVKSLG